VRVVLLADNLHRQQLNRALFLRTERVPDGRRTIRVNPREPLPTSYAADSYRRIFGEAAAKSPAALSQVAKAG